MDHATAETNSAGTLPRTAAALEAAGRRWDSRLVFLGTGGAYLVLYLVTVGDLSFVSGGTGGFAVRTVDDLSRAFASLGFFRFDAVAVVSAGPVTYLFSPLNLLVTVVLSTLVGANFALSYLGVIQPRACGLESSTGVLAGVPALLSGAACCGPTILLVIGVQASATVITGFQFLVPVALAMLVGGLLLVGRQVDLELLSGGIGS
ncbi:hypothetical protein [Halobellus rarus]|uniref:Uncharacterized protein n=1 Tax=Halobellus rarus TaxID=1126237 RepID=A0ABD6CRC3_9EURY|nr:hypothetical protein [Halobellus rarus]